MQPSNKPCIYISKALTAGLVVVGVVLPPVIILNDELNARELNVKGDTSQVAWTSADTGVGTGPYVILAACTLRLTAMYDSTAFTLVQVNLALACAAVVLVCSTKTAMFKHELLAGVKWLAALITRGVERAAVGCRYGAKRVSAAFASC